LFLFQMKMLVLEAWCWSYGAAMWAWDHLEILLTIGILALMVKSSRSMPGAAKAQRKNS
jgi:hypothetical protein